MPLSRQFRYLAGLAFLLAAGLTGCALSEYESAMEKQQKRMAYLDEVQKAVSPEPIAWVALPESGPDGIRPDEIFFQPVKGVNTTSEKPASTPTAFQKVFNRYKSTSVSELRDLVVSASRDPEDEFRKRILQTLGMNPDSFETMTLGEQANRQLQFDYYHQNAKEQGDRKNVPFVYIHNGPIRVAIVYRPSSPEIPESLKQAINYSLTTLAVGPTANKKQTAFKGIQAPKPPPPKGQTREEKTQ